jgi:hypothetical protein
MPILASTMVMPELIPVTYAKLRAELQRELGDTRPAIVVVVSNDRRWVLVDEDSCLPRVEPEDGESVWRAALRDSRERGEIDAEFLGWAGEDRAGAGPIALVFDAGSRKVDQTAIGPRWAEVESALVGPDAEILRCALHRLDAAV